MNEFTITTYQAETLKILADYNMSVAKRAEVLIKLAENPLMDNDFKIRAYNMALETLSEEEPVVVPDDEEE